MGRKEEEAAWARVGKKPPKPSRHSKPKKPKPPTAAERQAAEAAKRREDLMPATGGFRALQDSLSQPKKYKKK